MKKKKITTESGKKRLSGKVKAVISAAVVIALAVSATVIVPRVAVKKPQSISFYDDAVTFDEFGNSYSAELSDDEGNTLFCNRVNGNVALADKNKTHVWMSCSKDAAAGDKAAVLTVTARNKKGDILTFNSTDNSVSYGTFECNFEKNQLTETFTFFDSEESAKKGFDENGLCFSVPVTYCLKNGKITATVDCEQIKLSKKLYIESISLLPGLMSASFPGENDKYLIPDGSGAEVTLLMAGDNNYSVSLPVYGADISYLGQKNGAYIPAYAFVSGGAMLSSFIEDGDALSTISSVCGGDNCSLYNTFTVVPVSYDGNTVKKGARYNGKLSLCFTVTTGENVGYSGFAATVRDLLVKKDYLSDAQLEILGDYKFFINLVCSADGKKNSTLTSFEDAEEIVSFLKTKGVKSSYLRLSGALDGGLNQSKIRSGSVSKYPGGSEGLTKLIETAGNNGSSVWLDANIYAGSEPVKALSGNSLKAELYKNVIENLGQKALSQKLCGSTAVESNVSALYALYSQFDSLNLNINDASQLLYSDTDNKLTRADVAQKLASSLSAASVNSELMLSNPAVYLMRNATAVFNMPLCASTANGGVTSVPILQMVLHGAVMYGCEPINLSEGDMWQSVLKAVEYGACPTFLFTYKTGEKLSYGVYTSTLSSYYSKLKSLKAVQDMRITSHAAVAPGVYKTVYDYKKIVYVNYNSSVMMADGVLVAPQSFVLI